MRIAHVWKFRVHGYTGLSQLSQARLESTPVLIHACSQFLRVCTLRQQPNFTYVGSHAARPVSLHLCARPLGHGRAHTGFLGLFRGETMSAFITADIMDSQKLSTSASCVHMRVHYALPQVIIIAERL